MTSKNEVTVIDADGKSVTLSDLKLHAGISDLLEVDLTATAEAKWVAASAHARRGVIHYAAFGLLLKSIKEELPHGEFQPELDRRGFEYRTAARAMRYAEYVFSQPEQQQGRLLEMPVSKVAALAQADPEVVEVLMEDGETVEQTTVRGLVEMLQANKRKEKSWAERIARAERETEALRKRLQPVSGFNERTEVVRHSCVLLQQEADTALGSLQRTFDEVAAAPLAPEYEYQVQQLALTAQVVLARATALVLHMQALGDVQRLWPQEVRPHHLMTEGEAARWLSEAAHLSETQKARVAVATRVQDPAQTAKKPKAKANKPAGGKA
jgi:hypothetical protein